MRVLDGLDPGKRLYQFIPQPDSFLLEMYVVILGPVNY
jgi:hypothetical protein